MNSMRHRAHPGFTLIELLVVIAIVGILTAVGLVAMVGAREKARDAKRKSDLGVVRNALSLYYDTYNSYPAAASVESFGANPSGALFDALVTNSKSVVALPTPPQSLENYFYVSCTSPSGLVNGDYTLFTRLERPTVSGAYWVISASRSTTQQSLSVTCPQT